MSVHKQKKKSGGHSWRAFVRVNGKQIAKTFQRKVDAEAWEREQLEQRNIPLQRRDCTVQELVEAWLDRHVSALSHASQIQYQQICKTWILPAFGSALCSSLTSEQIQDWIQEQQTTDLSRGTINRNFRRLKQLLNWAVRQGYLPRNPAHGVMELRTEGNSNEKQFSVWSQAEAQTFLRYCKQMDVSLWRIVMGALNTGMRLGELVGLQWDKVDLQRCLIEVSRKWCNKARELQPCTKGRKSRMIGINGPLLEVLREARFLRSEWVYCGGDGKRIESNHLTGERFKPMCFRTGVPEIRFHDLRHTYAVWFMQAGGSVYELQQALGHKDITTTQQYLRFAQSTAEELVARASMVAVGGENNVIQLKERKVGG